MTTKEIRILRERLLKEKSRLIRRLQRNRSDHSDTAGGQVRDSGDQILMCTRNNYLKGESSLLALTLRQIEDALARIKTGTYGRCSACGKRIETKRLSAVPWALFCVRCQRRKEAGDSVPRQKAAFRTSTRNRQSMMTGGGR